MRTSRLLAFLACLMLMVFSFAARAQTGEPSVAQIYQTAESGDLPKARQMIDEVISVHPNSAKAHYVKSEIAARSKDVGTAKKELAKAEELAPGLTFVKPAAVTALRQQIDSLSNASAAPPQDNYGTRSMGAPPQDMQPRRASSGGFHLGSLVFPVLLVLGFIYLMRRRRANAPRPYPQDVYPPQGGYPPQGPYPTQGQGPGMYPPPGYGSYPQQREGMGSSIARGIGTGLAFGAGAAAAQEIGRRMFDHNGNENHPQHDDRNADTQLARDAGLGGDAGYDPSLNRDMGGQDFGFQDNGGWDDAGGGDFGMGSNDDNWN